MSAFIEVMMKGNCRGYLDAGSIMGVITSPDCAGETPATVESPMTIIMRSGDTIPDVYGLSPNRLLLHAAGVRAVVRQEGRLLMIAYIHAQGELETMISHLISGDSLDA